MISLVCLTHFIVNISYYILPVFLPGTKIKLVCFSVLNPLW